MSEFVVAIAPSFNIQKQRNLLFLYCAIYSLFFTFPINFLMGIQKYTANKFAVLDREMCLSKRGILGSPRHSPHLWFIPSAHLDFLAIFIIPSSHLDIHTLTSPRVQIILSPHLDRHTLTSPRGLVIPKGGKIILSRTFNRF